MKPEPPIPEGLWDQIPPALQATLVVVFRQYERRIGGLEQRIRDLEE
jgi:hypothetical protein